MSESLRLTQLDAGHDNLKRMVEAGLPYELLAHVCSQFVHTAAQLADPDRALNNLERFLAAARSPVALGALFERDPSALPALLQIFSTSQYLSDLLVADPDSYDLLRMTGGQPVMRESLVAELVRDALRMSTAAELMALLRKFKRRESLRVAYGDIVDGQHIDVVTRQISHVADAVVEAATAWSRQNLAQRYGLPGFGNGNSARFVVLALGKLGGSELNYSSDIDLIYVYEQDGQTDGSPSISNQEYFERLSRDITKLVGESTDLGFAYRVDLRLRPEGSRGEVCRSFDRTLGYYDVKGRTWERQAYVKARAVAGDLSLGEELLRQLQPWVYRRYLSLADITGIKAIKRRIDRSCKQRGTQSRDVKTGLGGIRDIEFVIQFLQLVNGGALPEIRTGNTLAAIHALERAGCLTHQESVLLSENYAMLRKLEHRLQIMLDLQTHVLPDDRNELSRVAQRMGYVATEEATPLSLFEEDFRRRTTTNRQILDHLLHDLFPQDEAVEPEVDLINDPDPSAELIRETLGKYPFADPQSAYENLMALATERIRFLSTRRCRHFLSAIAPRLLQSIAATPDPDATLVNLAQVSDSLGGKAMLWELFSINPPSLSLYVTLCAACPYLADILTSNPGMIDELMDSLVMESLPNLRMLEGTLEDLCRGAEDLDPILHSFKHAFHLRVGVRDVLGKDDIRDTHAALSHIAETCLKQIAAAEYERLVAKYGVPTIGELPGCDPDDVVGLQHEERFAKRIGMTCEPIILALGKLGGREPNYHSDLDIIFLFESDGFTKHSGRNANGKQTTTNGHFFSEWGQRIIKVCNQIGPYGRLFEVDPRLRPTGKSGLLAVPLDAFHRYFHDGHAQLWERLALCKARPVFGSSDAIGISMQTVSKAAYAPAWEDAFLEEIYEMRLRLEETATPGNIKRGFGGTVDIEFLVQMLQLKHGGSDPNLRIPGTLDALAALGHRGHLARDDADYFRRSYRFQRSVEARIRLMNSTGRHQVPREGKDLQKLAYLLGYQEPAKLLQEVDQFCHQNRARFLRHFRGEGA